MNSSNLRCFVVAIALGFVTNVAKADELTELDWQQTLEKLYQDIGNAYQKFTSELGEGQSSVSISRWVGEFSGNPFVGGGTSQDLTSLSNRLQDQFNDQQLSQEARQQLHSFVDVLQGISSDLTAGIAGNNTMSNSTRVEELSKLESMHDADQAWVDAKGRLLAQRLENYDFEGAISLLGEIINDHWNR
ncbi:MAG: hypothetical protein MI867_26605 [Pseudomonadales bacterium]|nr:hypothetical protein [Pseudomonadales bacterium]